MFCGKNTLVHRRNWCKKSFLSLIKIAAIIWIVNFRNIYLSCNDIFASLVVFMFSNVKLLYRITNFFYSFFFVAYCFFSCKGIFPLSFIHEKLVGNSWRLKGNNKIEKDVVEWSVWHQVCEGILIIHLIQSFRIVRKQLTRF